MKRYKTHELQSLDVSKVLELCNFEEVQNQEGSINELREVSELCNFEEVQNFMGAYG